MDFEQIPAGARITATVTNGGEMQARFISRVIKNLGNGILVIPFMHKGKRVCFKGKSTHIHIDIQLKTGETWTFKSCMIESVRKDGYIFHRVTSKMVKGIENRRGEHRCYIWEPAMFRIEGLAEPINTMMKDISISGFGFLLDEKKNLELMPGVAVNATLRDHKGNLMHIKGKIIRKEKVDHHVLYGCRCGEPNPQVAEYVKYIEEKTLIVEDSMVQIG